MRRCLPVPDEFLKIRQDSRRIPGMAEAHSGLLGSPDDTGRDCDISGKDHSKEHVHGLIAENRYLYGRRSPGFRKEGIL